MDVPADTIRSVMEKVDVLVECVESLDDEYGFSFTQAESDAIKLLPGLMDELQHYLDNNPPWRR